MPDDRDLSRSPAAQRPAGGRGGRGGVGQRISRRTLNGPRTLEAYLRASSPPRYMVRLREIEKRYQTHRRRLEAAYRELEEACGPDRDLFASRWRAWALAWSFEQLNELIREHNEWYPVEAGLAMDPRTRDYVPVHGRSYRRIELGPEWVLEHFPATRDGRAPRPDTPFRAPREPLRPRARPRPRRRSSSFVS